MALGNVCDTIIASELTTAYYYKATECLEFPSTEVSSMAWEYGWAGLLHTLSLVPVHVTWIVMEAGGVTNETAYFLSKARVHRLLHLGFGDAMPAGLKERGQLEAHMRVEGLRYSLGGCQHKSYFLQTQV